MAMNPTLLFYISRPNGNLVPLIPLDQLPPNVHLQGITRTLNLEEAEGIINLGYYHSYGRFKLEEAEASPSSRRFGSSHTFSAPDAMAKASITRAGTSEQRGITKTASAPSFVDPDSAVALSSADWRKANGSVAGNHGHTQSVLDAIISSNPSLAPKTITRSSQPSSNNSGPVNLEKKKYCSYWLRHGECDYMQQGCIFKHEMPTDAETLKKVGLRGIPRWYRERSAIDLGDGPAFSGRSKGSAEVAKSSWTQPPPPIDSSMRTSPTRRSPLAVQSAASPYPLLSIESSPEEKQQMEEVAVTSPGLLDRSEKYSGIPFNQPRLSRRMAGSQNELPIGHGRFN
ncbi:MAG: hypothetical protein M1819_000843 [Sarea resinae]|nr:MAG: hypothetical protein M1819_000843 [Sarea resinae]